MRITRIRRPVSCTFRSAVIYTMFMDIHFTTSIPYYFGMLYNDPKVNFTVYFIER